MSKLRLKVAEFGQLALIFVGFFVGIGLVVTCGGGSTTQGSSSTAGTISFVPLDFGNVQTPAGNVNIGVPPVLNGVTNVQDALNRLNVVMSPEFSALSDPLSPNSVADADLPPIIIDPSDGIPLTFSRKLSGLVRQGNLSGPLRSDVSFFLSCQEGPDINIQPFVSRTACLPDPVGAGRNGVFELFTESTIAGTTELAGGTADRLPNGTVRVRLDGFDSSFRAFTAGGLETVSLIGSTGAINSTGTITGATVASTGNVTAANDVMANARVRAVGDVEALGGNVRAGSVTPGLGDPLGGDVLARKNIIAQNGNITVGAVTTPLVDGVDVAAQDDVIAEDDVIALGMVTGQNGVTATTGNVAAAGGNVTASGDVMAGNDVTAGNDVVATNTVSGAMVSSTGNVTATNDVIAGNNVVATNNVGGTTVTSTGDITAGNDVNATNNVMATNNVVAGDLVIATNGIQTGGTIQADDLSATATITAGTTITGASISATTGNINAAAGNVTAGATTLANGQDVVAQNDVVAENGAVTAAAGDVLAPAGNVRAGDDPTASMVGGQISNLGLLTLNSVTSAACLIGNIDAGTGTQIFEIKDQSVNAAGTHVLLRAGEKGGAAPDGTGFVQVLDSTQAARIVLDAETGDVAADSVTVTTLNATNSTLSNLTVDMVLDVGTGPSIVLDGTTGELTVPQNIIASVGNIVAAAGNIQATAGSIAAGTDIVAGNDLVAIQSINATLGNINSVAGDVTAANDVIAGQNVTATAGNVTATAGDIVATAGNVTAGGMVMGNSASFTTGVNSGTGTFSGNVVSGNAGTQVTLDSTTGAVTADSSITSTTGNLVATAGDITATAGDVTAGNDVSATANVSAGGTVSAVGDVFTSTGDVVVQRGGNDIVTLGEDPVNPGHGAATVTASDGTTPLVRMRRSDNSAAAQDDGVLEVFAGGVVTGTIDAGLGMVTGIVKSFVQPDPENPEREIVYACLEGDENGLYARGTARLSGGEVYVTVPESFRLAASEGSLTVQITPMGDCMGLFVPHAEVTRNGFRVRELYNGASDVEFSWQINGVRRGMENFQPFRPATTFKPAISGEPFLPGHPGLQQVMIESGVLRADGTPDEAKFAELGWSLMTKEEARRERLK